MTTIQKLCPSYSLVQLLIMVLPQNSSFVSSEDLGKTSKKSSYIDIRSIQNISIIQHQDNCRSHPDSVTPAEA